jgi:hypothetical protein
MNTPAIKKPGVIHEIRMTIIITDARLWSMPIATGVNSSRDLKRLESVQRSPLYQQFGETLNGIVTIRELRNLA